jgi:hypothetical protein
MYVRNTYEGAIENSYHLGNTGVDGRRIINMIMEKQDMKVETAFNWLRT